EFACPGKTGFGFIQFDQFHTILFVEFAELLALMIIDVQWSSEGHADGFGLEGPGFLSVQLRWVARRCECFTAGIRPGDPVPTGAQMEFWCGEMCEAGAKFVDHGFNGLKVFGGWGRGIVGYKGGFSISSQIYRGLGVLTVGESYIRRRRILTAIFC